jgi:aldose 1-epimerase
MTPWPNRVEDGKYSFAGVEHQLKVTDVKNNNALHGLSAGKEWISEIEEPDKIRLSCTLDNEDGYPFKLKQLLTYRITDSGLFVKYLVQNIGETAAPFGFGWHPYLDCAGKVDDCKLLLDASTHVIPNERLLPIDTEPVKYPIDFTKRVQIGDTVLDDAFIDLNRGFNGKTKVLFTRADNKVIEIWADSNFNGWQLFSGDTVPAINRKALAIEPLTCLANAYNTEKFLITLQPGDEKVLKFGIYPH